MQFILQRIITTNLLLKMVQRDIEQLQRLFLILILWFLPEEAEMRSILLKNL